MEAVLVVVIVALLGERVWSQHLVANERRSLLNRIEAKHPGEFIAMERAATPRPKKEPSENGLQRGEHPVGL